MVIEVPIRAESMVFVIKSSWVNIKLTGAEVTAAKPGLADLVATTTHVVSPTVAKVLPLIEQLGPLMEKVISPVPDPPLVVRIVDVPAFNVNTVFEITNGF